MKEATPVLVLFLPGGDHACVEALVRPRHNRNSHLGTLRLRGNSNTLNRVLYDRPL